MFLNFLRAAVPEFDCTDCKRLPTLTCIVKYKKKRMGSKYTEIKNKTDLIFFLSVAKLANEASVELSNIFNVLVECLSNFLPVQSYFSLSVAFYTLHPFSAILLQL